nr:DUF3768 domain-containing protein [uncultured Cohaesibacter sp.]
MAVHSKTEQIRTLNDNFRRTFFGGQVLITNGTNELSDLAKQDLLTAIKTYSAFTPDNDPHGEHDFGSLKFQGDTFFWKIDCYDLQMLHHSPDPTNPSITRRVLTIMKAEEY